MSRKKERLREYEERIKQAVAILLRISEDVTTPRNIRKASKEAADILQLEGSTPAIKAANAISILSEISQDPNVPPYTRVAIWNALTLIEPLRDL